MYLKTNEIHISQQRRQKIQSSFETLIGRNPNDNDNIYIFGYGSILWNPFFDFSDEEIAEIKDYERSFCIKSTFVRGTPEIPGLLLALVEKKDAVTVGKLFGVKRKDLLTYLMWELSTGCYLARWLPVKRENREKIFAVTLIAKEDHHQYEGSLNLEQTAQRILSAEGTRGPCLEYFTNTVEQLEGMGVLDTALEKIKHHLLSFIDLSV